MKILDLLFKKIDYQKDSPLKILLLVSLPFICLAFIQTFLGTFSNLINRKFVGEIIFTVSSYFSGPFGLFANIVSAVSSAAWIKICHVFDKKESGSREIVQSCYAVGAVSIGLSALLMIFADTVLEFLNISAANYELAKVYYMTYFATFIVTALYKVTSTVVNGTGSSVRIFLINIVSTLTSLLVSYLVLAFVLSGVDGVLIATAISTLAMIGLDIVILKRNKTVSRLLAKDLKPDFKMIWQIIKFSVPLSLQHIFCYIGQISLTVQTNKYLSDSYIAVKSIGLPLSTLDTALVSAVNLFVPRNYSEGNFDRIKKFMRYTFLLVAVSGLLFWLVYYFVGPAYYGMMFSSPEYVANGVRYWRIYGAMFLCAGLCWSFRTFFETTGYTKVAFLAGVGELIGNCFAAFVLIPSIGNDGSTLGNVLGWGSGAIIMLVSYCILKKRVYNRCISYNAAGGRQGE